MSRTRVIIADYSLSRHALSRTRIPPEMAASAKRDKESRRTLRVNRNEERLAREEERARSPEEAREQMLADADKAKDFFKQDVEEYAAVFVATLPHPASAQAQELVERMKSKDLHHPITFDEILEDKWFTAPVPDPNPVPPLVWKYD